MTADSIRVDLLEFFSLNPDGAVLASDPAVEEFQRTGALESAMGDGLLTFSGAAYHLTMKGRIAAGMAPRPPAPVALRIGLVLVLLAILTLFVGESFNWWNLFKADELEFRTPAGHTIPSD